MTDVDGRTLRDEIRDMLYFRHPSGRVYHALPKMIPLPAEEAPLAAVLRAWHEAGRAEDTLQARATEILADHGADMPVAVEAMFKLLQEQPGLIFELFDERVIKKQINLYLSVLVSRDMSLP